MNHWNRNFCGAGQRGRGSRPGTPMSLLQQLLDDFFQGRTASPKTHMAHNPTTVNKEIRRYADYTKQQLCSTVRIKQNRKRVFVFEHERLNDLFVFVVDCQHLQALVTIFLE